MATNFPASLDTLTNPTSSDSLSSPSHSAQHANVNDAVEALQAKVGADSSAVTSSLDYKVAQLESDVAGFTSGKILQVVSTTKTDTFSASVASGAISGAAISASITPTSATSKVFVLAQVGGDASGTGLCIAPVLYRGGSVLTGALGDSDGSRSRTTSGGAAGADGRIVSTTPIMYLDSPSTTSATTYDVRIGHNSASTQTVYLNRSFQNVDSSANWRGISTITLIEVSA